MIFVVPFHILHQPSIDVLMLEIADEFPDPITSPASKKIADVAHFPSNKFWVAKTHDEVIGTIGLSKLSDNCVILKSMFLSIKYRGQGVGQQLLNHLIDWCRTNDQQHIYLGTMDQFKSGQQFYVRNLFKEISKSQLPADFRTNPLDSVFYWRDLSIEA